MWGRRFSHFRREMRGGGSPRISFRKMHSFTLRRNMKKGMPKGRSKNIGAQKIQMHLFAFFFLLRFSETAHSGKQKSIIREAIFPPFFFFYRRPSGEEKKYFGTEKEMELAAATRLIITLLCSFLSPLAALFPLYGAIIMTLEPLSIVWLLYTFFSPSTPSLDGEKSVFPTARKKKTRGHCHLFRALFTCSTAISFFPLFFSSFAMPSKLPRD